jgi:hypothetical protein
MTSQQQRQRVDSPGLVLSLDPQRRRRRRRRRRIYSYSMIL